MVPCPIATDRVGTTIRACKTGGLEVAPAGRDCGKPLGSRFGYVARRASQPKTNPMTAAPALADPMRIPSPA